MASMNDSSGPSGEHKQKNRTGERFHHDVPFGSRRPEPANIITRVQIHALISGEVSAPSIGAELLDRLTYLCAASGRRLHSLQVEFVQMPVTCPGCGHRAMHRCPRKG